MTKLLHADFSRLLKSRVFWLGMAVMIGLPLCAVCVRYHDLLTAPEYVWETADGLWFIGGIYIAVLLSVFISIWTGTDYNDGTIRNKLTIGHTRCAIYCSNLITCTAASLLYHIVYIAVLWASASVLLHPFQTPVNVLLIMTVLSFASVIAMSAVFTMLAMLIHNRSAGAVTAMLLALLMLIGSVTLYSMLNAPEYIENAYEMTVNGEIVKSDPIPNPRYLTGVKREVYQHVFRLIPVGQMLWLGELAYTADMLYLPLYAAAAAVVCTAVGLVIFRRKDIR